MLNTLKLSSKKRELLHNFFDEYLRVLNLTLDWLPEAKSSNELHHLTYSKMRETSFLPSDIIQEARKDVWARRKTIKNGFKRGVIRLSKRWFEFFETEGGTPCFKITYSPRKRFVIPVRFDGAYERFKELLEDDWNIRSIMLLRGMIAVSIEKKYPEPFNDRRYVVGVDVGSSTLAAVTVFDPQTSKVVKQLYLGRDVAIRQRKYEERRARLRSHADKGSRSARKYLKRLKYKQKNFVNTRSGQVAKEIVNLALKYGASIAIELLTIRGRKRKFNKKTNRKINRIPHARFREFLRSNCIMLGVPLHEVDAYHTSKWCPHCGAVNKGHSSNYALYKCKCGLVANSDRKSSLVIAIKSALVREHSQDSSLFSQFTRAGVSVNRLFRPHDGVLSGAVHYTQPLMENSLR